MTNSFLTVEDVNGVLYNNQDFWWHNIDTKDISDTKDFSDVKIDFCRVSRATQLNGRYKYTFYVDNNDYTYAFYETQSNEATAIGVGLSGTDGNKIIIDCTYPSIKVHLYMGKLKVTPIHPSFNFEVMFYKILNPSFELTLKELQNEQEINLYQMDADIIKTVYKVLPIGYSEIYRDGIYAGYVFVKLLKTDFQFQCTQQLTLGKVNTVQLGALTDYKPSGDMIGSNVPNITVKYGNIYIPVTFDSTLNDYVFDIDLTSKQTEGKVKFKVIVETNDVLNSSETEVTLNSSFETINNETKLQTLFRNGGIGRLGANITLTQDLTVNKDVLLIGNDKTLNMNSHKIIVPSEKTFKSENTNYTAGYNTIQQYTDSTVELNTCTFTNCTGFGSVIDCQTSLSSLNVENDFKTSITDCTFTNNDMCILHGGELNVTGCTVNGKIGNPNNPYFLYQTDGDATILQSKFNLTSNTQIETDIEFNSCIFICGEFAIINGNSHEELQRNNITSFISNPQNNRSIIDVTYYYPAIEDYITLESSNGYCHSVSDIDFVFKNNVTVRRE